MPALAFFAGPIGRWLVVGLLIAAFGAFAWFKGNEHGTQKLTDYIGEQAKETVRIVTKRGEVTERVLTKYVQVAGKTETVTRTVKEEVVKYAEANPTYCLDAGWRLLHDSAANNAISDASFNVDAAVRAPKAAEAIDTVATNYAGCHRTADRLDLLQEWVKDQAKVK